MQPILVIAAVAVGAGLLSTGFLATNNFEIWVQEQGFATGEIKSPFDHANIDFEVKAVPQDPDQVPDSGDEYFKNVISACSFHTFEEVADGTEVICKLQAWNITEDGRVVVCEGRDFIVDYTPSDIYLIGDLREAYPGACEVSNIDAVQIVATGEEPFSAFCDLETHFIQGGDGDNMFEPWGNDHIPDTEDDEQCLPIPVVP